MSHEMSSDCENIIKTWLLVENSTDLICHMEYFRHFTFHLQIGPRPFWSALGEEQRDLVTSPHIGILTRLACDGIPVSFAHLRTLKVYHFGGQQGSM